MKAEGRGQKKPTCLLRPCRSAFSLGFAFILHPSSFSYMSTVPQTLAGKTGLVFGVANKRSIAWGIAQAWAAAGAKLIFSYQGERIKGNVEELVEDLGADTPFYPCDVIQGRGHRRVFQERAHAHRPRGPGAALGGVRAEGSARRRFPRAPAARRTAWRTISARIRWWRSRARPRR